MTTENPDTDPILSEGDTLTLSTGFKVQVMPLKTQATLALLRIISRGAGDAIRTYDWDPSATNFQGQLIGAILFAIPEAPGPTLDFIRLMLKPAELHEVGRITKGDQAWNEEQWEFFDRDLTDPDLDDLFDVVTAIVTKEAPHIQALGKKIAALIPTMRRQLEAQTNSSESSEPKKSSRSGSRTSTQKASSAGSPPATT